MLAPGVYNFTTISIPAGVTVTTNGTGVLDLRATSTVTIAGSINVSGGPGQNGNPSNTAGGGGGNTGNPGTAGAGAGGTGGEGSAGGASGSTPGGDFGGGCGGSNVLSEGAGGGGGYAGGGGGGGGTGAGGTAANAGGNAGVAAYNGGAGANGGVGWGGGGGALEPPQLRTWPWRRRSNPVRAAEAAAGTTMVEVEVAAEAARCAWLRPPASPFPGSVLATGGAGGGINGSAGGGGGSGGVIYLSAPVLIASGTVNAAGGVGGVGFAGGGNGGAGGLGRIRIERRDRGLHALRGSTRLSRPAATQPARRATPTSPCTRTEVSTEARTLAAVKAGVTGPRSS